MRQQPRDVRIVGLALGLAAAALLAGCNPPAGTSAPAKGGGSGIPRKDWDVKSSQSLRQIGMAYLQAQIASGAVKGPQELESFLEGHGTILVSPRDKQPYEIVWRVDPSKIAEGSSNVLLAWERTADPDGNRWVLFADCQSVKKLSEQEFENTPKAKQNS